MSNSDDVSASFDALGRALSRLRRRAGLTTEELAARLGISQSGVVRVESPSGNPTWSSIRRHCVGTHHTADQLLQALKVEQGRIPSFDFSDSRRAQDEEIIQALVRQVDHYRRLATGTGSEMTAP